MSVTYDINSDIGKVRLIISDTDTDDAMFTDEEIEQFLIMSETNSERDIRIASAHALVTIATSQALIQKKIKMLELSTDGPAVAKTLKEMAQKLRDTVENEPAFGIAEIGYNNWTTYQMIISQALREY